jgi:transposase InsO family protein
MPWLATDTMKERTKFVLEWERRSDEAPDGRVNLSELAREFGISRDTAYVWLNRYRDAGSLDALRDRSRRPHSSPTKIPDEIAALVVAAKKQYPKWGPRKLRALLVERYPHREWPSASCMSTILTRHGLTRPRRTRRRAPIAVTAPFAKCVAPNDVWCIDFKGKFRTRDGTWCHVLTLVDAYSRFLLRCEVLVEPNGRNVQRVLDSAFQEFGLPSAMRSDNGTPFASTGPGGLTALSVWWLRLGIELQRIQPGKPQQNGRQERVHLTMEEVVASPAANPRSQQSALDVWRYEYNEVRPHEALAMKPPATVYERSRRRYPRKLVEPECYEPDDLFNLDRNGRMYWRRRWVLISSALRHQTVQVTWHDDFTHLDVHFGPIRLGTIDTEHLERGLRIARRRRTPTGDAVGDVLALIRRE